MTGITAFTQSVRARAPFSDEANDMHLHVSTGRAASEKVKVDLTQSFTMGNKWCEDYKAECFADPSRFEKPIQRRKVKNFTTDGIKTKVTGKDMRIKEVQITRDFFGRLRYLATIKELDLQKVLSHPITPVPASLGHIDGSLHKTAKASLLKKLEAMSETIPPRAVDACVIDAMFLIRSLVDLPKTFCGVAKQILTQICAFAPSVDFVCDTYKSPSIKDIERGLCGPTDSNIIIAGPEQRIPADFHRALSSGQFKVALFKFLAVDWQKNCYSDILLGHTVYLALEKVCYRFQTITSLICWHEEADTCVVMHVHNIAQGMRSPRVVVRANDMDILVIFLYHAANITAKIWMDMGHSYNNSCRYVDVSTLAQQLGHDMCKALPALHAFTGCDYTASFMRKGKIRPFDLIEKSKTFTSAFARIGIAQDIPECVLVDIEMFVCMMYGKPGAWGVNDARFDLFKHSIAPSARGHPLKVIKHTDPSLLPPCHTVLANKIKQTNYVAYMWKNADQPDPIMCDAEESGWVTRDGIYAINWFEGDQIPQEIENEAIMDSSHSDDDDDSSYDSASAESADCDSD